MTRSIDRKRSMSKGANLVDVKWINWGELIPEDNVQIHSANWGTGNFIIITIYSKIKSKIKIKNKQFQSY